MVQGTPVHLLIAMNYPSHLTRAPITEAVLDVLVAPAAEGREDVFASFRDAALAEFPEANPIRQFQTQFAVNGTESSQSHAQKTLGVICWNRDKTRAVQARIDGFSVNHVKSYDHWEALLSHAQTWWAHYRRLVTPSRVVRCGVRFINQFPITPDEELRSTLRTRPELAAGLPQKLDEYFQRLVIPFPDGIRAAITQVVQQAEAPSHQRMLVLDIDVSIAVDLDANAESMWLTFERLRAIKNQCFFESLQEAKWEDFK
jgi:uncharacterized protein (TIGR04255 family)